jgi:hypothetical protein
MPVRSNPSMNQATPGFEELPQDSTERRTKR